MSDGGVPPIMLRELFDRSSFSAAMRARFNVTADRLGRNPQLSLPQALGGSGYKGLMRALNNPRVAQAELLDAVYRETIERIEPGEELLSVEDTTDLIFGGSRGRKGLPRLEAKGTGFRAHIALCVRMNELVDGNSRHDVLGVLDLEQIVRDEKTKASANRTSTQRYQDPNKESLRWHRTVERAERLVAGRASLIHVRDREADDYVQLCAMVHSGQRFVQRMRVPRRLAEPPEHDPTARKIDEAVRTLEGVCEREVHLSPRGQGKFDRRPAADRQKHPARRGRQARLRFEACSICVRRPNDVSVSLQLPDSLRINVVHVREVDVPPGEQAVEWYLLTGEPIVTVEQVERVVDIYRARWLIEEFNKALQTGCQYEKLQMETADRLWSMLAFYCPIATNLLALRTLAHRDTEASAEQILDEDEIEVLRADNPKLRSRPISVQMAVLLIARIGGHFSHNGPPGWLTLLRGMVTLRERAEGWRLARQLMTRAPP